MWLKARIFSHGNCYNMKNEVRKDSSTEQFETIRMLLSIFTLIPIGIGIVYIRGSYILSGPIKQEIFV